MYNPCWAYAERILSHTEHTGTNFIACWAYWEPISSHAEHARKCLKVEYLSRIEYDFQKSRVTGPWDHKVSVSAKKYIKKFHVCVPLNLKWCNSYAWMRSSLEVWASDCQCRSRNSPGFDPSMKQCSIQYIKKSQDITLFNLFAERKRFLEHPTLSCFKILFFPLFTGKYWAFNLPSCYREVLSVSKRLAQEREEMCREVARIQVKAFYL